ncbi:hypothetical protein G4D82_09695 [Flavobacterium sp. CYK-4]|uniref:DKNYY domain-containing protein n=1 Tax=Flavobacterium lotistagni TaxID=2709660 RepID=UPI001407F1BE|nr:DKNYY domain-containing protein [Flavobacterium lotistagni]NHM07492.1 hypothetical protein [Flavobacterium lotistagni]
MRKTNVYLILFLILSLYSCEEKYIIENESVYFKCNRGGGFEMSKELIAEADSKTFESLEYEDVNGTLGKDKESVFYNGQVVKSCDPKTFKYLGNYLFKDKNSLFFFGFYNTPDDWKIDGVNINKIKLFSYPWSTDGEYLIFGYQKLKLDDVKDFKPIDEQWGKTKSKIIYENKVLEMIDYNSFEVINYSTAKDKNHTYTYGDFKIE